LARAAVPSDARPAPRPPAPADVSVAASIRRCRPSTPRGRAAPGTGAQAAGAASSAGLRWAAGEGAAPPAERQADALEIEVDDRSRVEGEQLRHDEAPDDGNAERAAQLGADAGAKGERQASEQRGHGRHHDRPEAQKASLPDGIHWWSPLAPLDVEREVDH